MSGTKKTALGSFFYRYMSAFGLHRMMTVQDTLLVRRQTHRPIQRLYLLGV